MNEPIPVSVPAQNPAAPARSSKKVIVTAVLVIVILAILTALYFVRIQGDRLGNRIIETVRLHGVTLVSVTDSEPRPYSLGVLGLKDTHVAGTDGGVVEYAKGGSMKAFISRDAQAETDEVILVAGKKQVGTPAPHMAALAVSASGNFIAYSVSTSTETQRLSDWNMHMYDNASNRDIELGTGYGAQFVTHEGKEFLIYTTAEGIQYVALDTFDGFLTPFDITDNTFYAVKASPDGRYLATRDAALREWGLMEITKLEIGFPIRMTPLQTDLSVLTSVTFTDSALVGIEPVWSDETHSQSSSIRIHTLPLNKVDGAASTAVAYTFPTTSLFVFNHL